MQKFRKFTTFKIMVILCITLCIKSFGNFMRFAMISNLKRLDFKVLEMKSIKLKLVILKAKQLGNLLFPLWKTALPAICKCVLHDSWCTFSNVVCVVVQAWASTNFALEWVAGELKAKQSTFQNDSQVNFLTLKYERRDITETWCFSWLNSR